MTLDDRLRSLRCPNEPADKEGLLTDPERHEVFKRDFRITVTARYINNGRQWGFDRSQDTARDIEPSSPIVCETCGAVAEVSAFRLTSEVGEHG